MTIVVDTAAQMLTIGALTTPCVIGRGGVQPAEDKREGDGATPLGTWSVRCALLRPGRSAIPPSLPWRWLSEADGWSDDAADPAYNCPVRLPHIFGHERLWRADQAYDVIVVLGHNDTPPIPGSGSAIFFHLWVPGENGLPGATEGCVAVAPDAMQRILPLLAPGMAMDIRRGEAR